MAIKWKFPARTATVHCSGGCRAKRDENGGLLCAYGCVACGACVEACRFGAVQINDLGCAEVDEEKCIGCGMCSQACPWNMPRVDSETGVSTKCISCGRCAEQCPNGAIKFIDWEDIAQKVIDQGVVRTTTLVQA